MTTLGVSIFVIACFVIINRKWLRYIWKEYIYDDFNPTAPPFCFDCDCNKCDNCLALKAYKEDPNKGWTVFEIMQKNQDCP